jgi:hypothetical protein
MFYGLKKIFHLHYNLCFGKIFLQLKLIAGTFNKRSKVWHLLSQINGLLLNSSNLS